MTDAELVAILGPLIDRCLTYLVTEGQSEPVDVLQPDVALGAFLWRDAQMRPA